MELKKKHKKCHRDISLKKMEFMGVIDLFHGAGC